MDNDGSEGVQRQSVFICVNLWQEFFRNVVLWRKTVAGRNWSWTCMPLPRESARRSAPPTLLASKTGRKKTNGVRNVGGAFHRADDSGWPT
jgi:hypothetical protein